MNTETIKSFLISLGFDIDGAGAAKFDATILGVTKSVIKLGAVVEGAALSVVAFTTKIAAGLDDLYWASQRTGATVAGIQSLGYAASQTGGSVAAARGSLEGLARFLRSNPGGEGFLNRLGVETRDASGQARSLEAVFTGLGQKLSTMPYYRANQYAQMLGIDENTLMAMRRGMGEFTAQYNAMKKAIGFNPDAAAASSNRFMTSMRAFGEMAGMARDKIGSSLTDGLAGSIDRLRKQILDNFPKIEKAMTAVIKGILWLGDVVGRVVYRLIQAAGGIIDWWNSLDKSTQRVIEVLGALVVAWKVLNSAFIKSPIGIIIALAAALGALIEDYVTWKEGGKSLIDWSKWQPDIEYAMKGIKSLGGDFGDLYDKVSELGSALVDAGKAFLEFLNIDTSHFSGKWLFDQIIESVRSTIKYIGALVDVMKKLVKGDFSGAWDSMVDAAKILADSPVAKGVTKVAVGLADKAVDAARKYLPEWMGGKPAESETEPEQHAQSVKNPQLDTLNRTQADSRQDAAKSRQERNAASSMANTWLGRISLGIQQLHDALAPQQTEGNIGEQAPYLMRGQQEGTPPVKVPQPTKEGAALLGWMRPALANLERLYNLPAGLLRSVALAESGGDQFATSKAGAQGMFQFMPDTAKDLGLKGNDAFDPMKSADAAARYLSQLLRRSGGDLNKALASYNWGMGNVEKYGMGLLPRETREYVPKVMSNMPQAASPSYNQQTTINIHGVTDPREAGNIVAGKQQGIMSNGIQQLTTGPR
ncbi:lytic transglycosylase domain-containing protein [Phytobacter diazotrophicus]|uniref:lytic transglycosylase domain-containing protein n=1 Tax=Phytobacter diazotrophicus TaxID=395631 RepID=UPI002FF3EBA4